MHAELPYRKLAEKYTERAQAVDVSNETGAMVNALTAIAYALIDVAEAIDKHEG